MSITKNKYCNSLTSYERFKTRVVKIGNLLMGGDYPIRLQSMTTTDTMNTDATVQQSIKMIEAGCELVRITAPSKSEAENLRNIKQSLLDLGYNTPLVADIHFTPNAAEIASEIVEKVRVNPGNYADKKKFENIEYTDETYYSELERIRERFTPLVLLCKKNKTAMRIGTNHGSLSDRILSRYGDTPLGMVESAMEFLRICQDNDFNEIVLSMKASSPIVMVQAYRLLVNYMIKENMNYPLHLGVTEAGDGEDGRIKSAVGIGTLLEDGLGDTIRVSLTEDPELEIPVAKMLADRYINRANDNIPISPIEFNPIDPFEYRKRNSFAVNNNVGAKNAPIVFANLSERKDITPAALFAIGYTYSLTLDKWTIGDMACDYLFVGNLDVNFEIPGTLCIVQNHLKWNDNKDKARHFPLFGANEFFKTHIIHDVCNFVTINFNQLTAEFFKEIEKFKNVVLVLETSHALAMAEQRRAFIELINNNCSHPVIVKRDYNDLNNDEFQLYASTDAGALFLDGLGDGIWLDSKNQNLQMINRTSFGILQATRTRISKTEYISCPSCGRTLFDLQETTAKIRSRTSHLKGLKIGIMGCIVNGPGEMADADYGYVGTGVDKITLYKEKNVVKRNVASKNAVDELIELIKINGDWIEPSKID
jgi:(E)-4-hydroxy-3-methylbut-2-enyl-diphosphate synthase